MKDEEIKILVVSVIFTIMIILAGIVIGCSILGV